MLHKTIEVITELPGLKILYNFISKLDEEELISQIDKQEWQGNGKDKRRIQQYGALYDFEKHELEKRELEKSELKESKENYEFPDFLVPYLKKIAPFVSKPINQAFINEYVHHQGIGPHIDNIDNFGPEILSLSLNASTVIVFAKANEKRYIFVPPGSLLIMSGEARYQWTHEIPYSKIIRWNEPASHIFKRPKNYRRISITFRSLNQ